MFNFVKNLKVGERKMLQAESMMENNPVNVILTDLDLKIRYMNPLI